MAFEKPASSALSLLTVVIATSLAFAWHAIAQPATSSTGRYPVEGVGLGDVITQKAVFPSLKCSPSTLFASSNWCVRSRQDKGANGPFTNTIAFLYSDDGRVTYLARVIEPAFFGPDDFDREIARLSNLNRQKAQTLLSPPRPGLPRGVIASWGDVTLVPLDRESVQALASGSNPGNGFLVDFLGNFKRSAQEDMPIFVVSGGAGMIWSANVDDGGKGYLRITGVDSGKISLIGEPATGNQAAAGQQTSSNSSSPRPLPAPQPSTETRNVQSPAAGGNDTPLTDCDVYAANDLDPNRKSAGVQIEKIDVGKALPACFEATSRYPNSARLKYQLGRIYMKKHDYGDALHWYQEAADKGYGSAEDALGFMYKNGLGLAQDYAQALAWFRKAAAGGNPRAQLNLAGMYDGGLGVKQDYAEALDWIRKSADQGYEEAKGYLCDRYFRGMGTRQSPETAVPLCMSAAAKGNALAQDDLGLMYATGQAVPKDVAQAFNWFQTSANQGFADGEYNLGQAYQYGFGVTWDNEQAVAWLKKAAEHGSDLAKEALRKIAEPKEKFDQAAAAFLQQNPSEWVYTESTDKMSGNVVAQVVSEQRATGITAKLNGVCENLLWFNAQVQLVHFTVLVVDDEGKPTIDIVRGYGKAARVRIRINDTIYDMDLHDEDYNNNFVVINLIARGQSAGEDQGNVATPPRSWISGSAVATLPANNVWGVLVEFKTDQGKFIVSIPTLHNSIRKLIEKCASQL